jgi:DNA-binding transcriptional ArsR family regulator
MLAGLHPQFVNGRNMSVKHSHGVSAIAAAIGEPARARILYSLMDGRARTSTELAVVAEVSPSTASEHLNRLKAAELIRVLVQGKHRYYSLQGPEVAHVLEGLSVLAGAVRHQFKPTTPSRLCAARTCYDHMAGSVAVSLHDRFQSMGWLSTGPAAADDAYELTPAGCRAIQQLGIDLEATRRLRRRFACACLDWSERRPHIGGALGAALLKLALTKKWVAQDLDCRALAITSLGRREMLARFGLNTSS